MSRIGRERSQQEPDSRVPKIARSSRGMVATAQWRATEAGVRALELGGNAVDAAVAAAFALSVCEPAASGLGGQTMMLLHEAASRLTIALDGSSRAPGLAAPGSLSARQTRRGYRAPTIPSTPATLAYALRTYGRLDLDQVLVPAIELAEEGYEITGLQHALLKRERRHLKNGSAAEVFLIDGRRVPPRGSMLRQPALARTLRVLARKGIEEFYQGGIARAIDADMRRNDGLIRKDDLARIPWPVEREPLSCRFGTLSVRTFPPPAAGRTLVEMINILSHFRREDQDPDTPAGAVLLAKVIQQAFRDRRDRPRDPDAYEPGSGRKMISPEYARRVARRLRAEMEARGETTHLSVMDAEGNAVALTQSIERVFGSCEITPELGFLYNDYLSTFELRDSSHPYYLRPGGVPWANVAPTLAFKGRRPWLAIGSPGSERITPSILQVMLRLRRRPSRPLEAVDAPRLHCSTEGKVSLEVSRMHGDIPGALRAHGFTIDEREAYSFYLGCVQLVMRDRAALVGVADPRRDGSAAGPA